MHLGGYAMSDGTSIQWSDATWNPVTGCESVSAGCDHCYARTFAERWRGTAGHYFEHGFDLVLRPTKLDEPLAWRKPRRIFVNSMSDLFHKNIPDEYIARVFAVMARCPQHAFQLLTKRHARMRSLIGGLDGSGHRLIEATTDEETAQALHNAPWPLPNLHLGVSVEDQRSADTRIITLFDTPAAVRWVSIEPMISAVDLTWCAGVNALERDWNGYTGAPHALLDWVVVGGETGPVARPMDVRWARALVSQCQHARVPVFVKQLGVRWDRDSHADPSAWPEDLRVREFPRVGNQSDSVGAVNR